jgi:hypothetical protein
MESNGSLACSQEPDNGPYPQPDGPSPLPPFLFPQLYFNIIL